MGFFDLTIVSIFFITALSNSAYALIAPFLPFEFKKKGINQSVVGYIFSIFSLAVILTSPLIGKMINSRGRRPFIRLGVLFMGLSFIAYGLIAYIEDNTIYIMLSFTIRFIQGVSSSSIQTACYSICTNFYPDKKETIVGYIEAVTGIGLIMGPIVGSILYSLGGFSFTFYVFGTIFLAASFYIYKIFPKTVDAVENSPLIQ